MKTDLKALIFVLLALSLSSPSFAQADQKRPAWQPIKESERTPRGVPVYKPIAPNAIPYFEHIFIRLYGPKRAQYLEEAHPGGKFDGMRFNLGFSIQEIPGFGVPISRLDTGEMTVSSLYTDEAITFGISGIASVTGQRKKTSVVYEYGQFVVVPGVRIGDYATTPQQLKDGIHSYDFRLGFAARMILSTSDKNITGSGSILNYLNLGGSHSKRLEVSVLYQVVGIHGPEIGKAIPSVRVIRSVEDLEKAFQDFQKLTVAITGQTISDSTGGLKANAGTIITPRLFGAIEYTPPQNVERSMKDSPQKAGSGLP